MDGETCVVTLTETLPAGTQLVIKTWPSAALPPLERWHVAARRPGELSWAPPGVDVEIVRVQEGT